MLLGPRRIAGLRRTQNFMFFPSKLMPMVSSIIIIWLLDRAFSWSIPFPGGGKVSFQDGILRIQTRAAPNATIPPPGSCASSQTLHSIEIRDTGTVKGYGAYCISDLPQCTFLGFYPDDCVITDLKESASSDYVLSLDGGATFLDGYARAQNRTVFSPAHLNHADSDTFECNCFRLLQNRTVAFFTSRDIRQGEELCFDYGPNYWRGRRMRKYNRKLLRG